MPHLKILTNRTNPQKALISGQNITLNYDESGFGNDEQTTNPHFVSADQPNSRKHQTLNQSVKKGTMLGVSPSPRVENNSSHVFHVSQIDRNSNIQKSIA